MEKIEKNLVNTKRAKNMIKASTILDITLEDYHKSRLLYGQEAEKEQQHDTIQSKKEKDYNLPRSERPNTDKYY
jgi:hypothetical protein